MIDPQLLIDRIRSAGGTIAVAEDDPDHLDINGPDDLLTD